jgi:hypothetical protein
MLARRVGEGASSRCGSGLTKMMQLLVAPAEGSAEQFYNICNNTHAYIPGVIPMFGKFVKRKDSQFPVLWNVMNSQRKI